MNRHHKDPLEHWQEVLAFLKSRFPLYHQSNFFFRDLQYGIRAMLEEKNTGISYQDAERLAREFASAMEKRNIFTPIDPQTWVVNYPEYRTPVTKPAPAARPAAAPAVKPAQPNADPGAQTG